MSWGTQSQSPLRHSPPHPNTTHLPPRILPGAHAAVTPRASAFKRHTHQGQPQSLPTPWLSEPPPGLPLRVSSPAAPSLGIQPAPAMETHDSFVLCINQMTSIQLSPLSFIYFLLLMFVFVSVTLVHFPRAVIVHTPKLRIASNLGNVWPATEHS